MWMPFLVAHFRENGQGERRNSQGRYDLFILPAFLRSELTISLDVRLLSSADEHNTRTLTLLFGRGHSHVANSRL